MAVNKTRDYLNRFVNLLRNKVFVFYESRERNIAAAVAMAIVSVLFIYEKWAEAINMKNQDFQGTIIEKKYSPYWHIKISRYGSDRELSFKYYESIFEKMDTGNYIIKKEGEKFYSLIKG